MPTGGDSPVCHLVQAPLPVSEAQTFLSVKWRGERHPVLPVPEPSQ